MSEWYDVDKTLSHNCLLNFVMGPRGVGKTYSAKIRVIKNYIKSGEQFVYLRRYETELKKSQIENFFNDVALEFPEIEFRVQNGSFIAGSEVIGYYIPLTAAVKYKSVPFPKVSIIIFDEFIVDTGFIRYLPNEVIQFFELYSTVARLRDVKVLFLSNAISFTNPYFLYFDIKLQNGQKILKKGDMMVELVENTTYQNKVNNTRFGKLISGTDYGKYAIENKFLRDSETFVEKMPSAGKPLFLLSVQEKTFCVYAIRGSINWYVSEKLDKTVKRKISLDIGNLSTENVYARDMTGLSFFTELKQKFYRAEVRFTTITAKNVLMPYLKKTNL